ncbi:helix-turn-helix domain-containing protein [Streptomyces sp. NRRL B-1347]|uniref:helix-turn-helix domain-containing protein n=1 Tax=Streptomyces sp. NRRL B-1347 TaxID=1476877 RepID=UPI0004C6B2E0|nr:helix-turn-helix transcriptional regulator [Streptomyces sp. NRRL B-1347]
MAEAHGESRRIGEEIRRARVLQRRSQHDVASELGYHQSKLSRLERGHGTEDIRVLRAVALELGIPLGRLGLAPTPCPAASRSGGEEMQRRAFLTASIAALAAPTAEPVPKPARHDLVQALLPVMSAEGTGVALDLPRLGERIGTARKLFYACEYSELEGVLPALITDLRAASGDATDRDALSALLATAYQTSASLLLKQHDQGNAWLAVGRAMAEAERSGDPVVLASSIRVQAHALAREKHTSQAVALVRHAADQLTGAYDRRSPKHLAAVGLLLLRGATAASGAGDRAAAEDFLAEAGEAARYVAVDRTDAWANFSPTNVALHELSALVAFGDAGLALRAAGPLLRRPIPVPERRAALWVETARAYTQQERLPDAYRALRVAERCAAQDVRRPAVRELVADMAARDARRTLPELHHFHRRLGAIT